MKAEAIARARMEEEDEEDALRGIGVQDQKKRKTPGGEFGGLDGVYEGGEGGETMLRVRKKRKRMMASKDGGQRDAGKRKRVRWDLEEEDTKVIEQQVRVRRSGRKKMKLV